MPGRIDILDQRDPLGGPFLGSLLLHGGLLALLLGTWLWLHRSNQSFGDLHPAGGPAYSVSAVDKIPIPRREAPENPVAADTASTVRSAPSKQDEEKKLPVPDKNAFQIPDLKKRQAEQPLHQQKYMQPAPQNQVYSRSRTAVSNPMYGGASGSGQVGIGPDSPLGTRLGWYAELVRQQIARQWMTSGLDSASQRSPAIVSFAIMRDGSVRDVRVVQPSGNPNIDNTALRAVYESRLPPLPPQVSDNSITAQFTFNLR